MTKIVAISDIHGMWQNLDLPEGDILVVAGDCTGHGTNTEFNEFISWIETLVPSKFKYAVITPGNHDINLENAYNVLLENHPEIKKEGLSIKLPDKEIYLLIDSSVILEDLKIYATPWMPNYYNWSFMYERNGIELKDRVSRIPLDTDILITHSPPYGIRDKAHDEEKTGCELLSSRILEMTNLKAHFFGHIHEGYGSDGVHHNVAICTIRYKPTNRPTEVFV